MTVEIGMVTTLRCQTKIHRVHVIFPIRCDLNDFLYLEFPQRKKIVMATNNSGLNSTSFTVKSDLKEGREQELTGHAEASEEDSCGKFMQHLDTCLRISEADRVLCHLIMF